VGAVLTAADTRSVRGALLILLVRALVLRYAAYDPVYSPNSKGGPRADTQRYGEPAGWHTDGEMVRTAYTLRAEDDDWGAASWDRRLPLAGGTDGYQR
jgi:hypothetical protein